MCTPYYKLNPETNEFERHILTRIDSKDAKELEKILNMAVLFLITILIRQIIT